MMMRGRRTRPSRSRRDDARAAFATSRSTPTISPTCPLARPTIADGRDGRSLARIFVSVLSRAVLPVRSRSARSPCALSPVSLVHQAMLTSKVSTGIKAQKKAVRASKATGAVAFLDNKKAAAVALAAAVAVATPAFPAKADLTSDLIAKSEANKELNDKKRAATSSANFERSRTVTDGVCNFPKNFFGCEIASSNGGVKFLSDDKDIECEGTRDGKVCASKAPGSFPPVFGM